MFELDGRYNAHQLIKTPLEAFKGLPDVDGFYVECDDGVVYTSTREMLYTRYLWELYAAFPVITIRACHHLSFDDEFVPDTPDRLMNKIFWDCFDLSKQAGHVLDKTVITRRMYWVADQLFELYRDLPEYVMSINITDYIQIMDDPDIHAALVDIHQKERVQSADISRVYKVINTTIETKEYLQSAPLVIAHRSRSIKPAQFNKCIGPNGFITDVDSHMFRQPVVDSFVSRLTKIEDILMESRTAAMSIFYQSKAMQDSEYLTRQLQLQGECIWRVHEGMDCGSRNYTPLYVPEGKKPTDLTGKYYLDPADGKEKLIPVDDRNIRGTIIKYRSAASCQLGDRYGICERCYGTLTDSLMPGDNVGHIAATVLQKKQTQNILSNKHLVGSASVEPFIFQGEDLDYLENVKDSTKILVSSKLKGINGKLEIIFREKEASKLEDIYYLEDIDTLSPRQISSLTSVRFIITRNDTIVRHYEIGTSTESRKAFFTAEFLTYLRDNKTKVDSDGNHIVDLTGWNFKDPIMDMPMVQYSTPAHMQEIKRVLTSSGEGTLSACKTPGEAINKLWHLVRTRLDVNIAHIELLVVAAMAEDPKNNDYRIPKDKSKGKLANYSDIMARRDSALAMAYEDHYLGFFSRVDTYIIEHRQVHPFNKLLRG